jgi:hypothetical protein
MELIHHRGQGVCFLTKAVAGGGSLFDHCRIVLGNLIHLIYCRVNFAQANRLFFRRGGDFGRHTRDLRRLLGARALGVPFAPRQLRHRF